MLSNDMFHDFFPGKAMVPQRLRLTLVGIMTNAFLQADFNQ
jgi:hypothetical protein